jgi:hypothetical protein
MNYARDVAQVHVGLAEYLISTQADFESLSTAQHGPRAPFQVWYLFKTIKAQEESVEVGSFAVLPGVQKKRLGTSRRRSQCKPTSSSDDEDGSKELPP